MNFLGLVRRSLRLRAFSSLLTSLSVALGVMLVVAILLLRTEVKESFERPGKGYSLVIGPPKSEPLTLVLNSIFHVGQSTGFVPFQALIELEEDPSTRLAVPYAVGDSFRGYRVVATTDAVFSRHFPHPAAETTEAKFEHGRAFRFDAHALEHALEDLKAYAARKAAGNPDASLTSDSHDGHDHANDVAEAVLGADVARALRLKVGDRIEPTHGVEGEAEHAHDHEWTVVGILKETGTPVDRVVFINLDSFYRIADHAGGLIPETGEPGLSTILLFPKPGFHKATLLARLNKASNVQVAEVASQMSNLFAIVGNIDSVLFLMAVLTVIIGVVAILVAIYNSMNERRREIAILRALGAKVRFVVATIVAESTLLAFLGGLVGVLLGHGLIALLTPLLRETAHLAPNALRFEVTELLVLFLVTAVGALAGFIPAMKAYRTDVAQGLSPTT